MTGSIKQSMQDENQLIITSILVQASIATLLHDLSNAKVDLQPMLASQKLQYQQGRNLNQIHGQEWNRIIPGKHRITALQNLRECQFEAALRLPKSSKEKDLVHYPIAISLWLRCHNL